MKQLDLIGIHVTAGARLPVLLLRETEEPRRVLQLFIGPAEANSIALAVSGRVPPRPMTHDLMTDVLTRLGGHVDAVEVTGLTDGTFYAALVVGAPDGSHRVDTRPSDAIALAVRNGAPIYAADSVLDEAGSFVADDGTITDPERIEAEVAEFRSLLERLDVDDLAGSDDLPPNDLPPNDLPPQDPPPRDGPPEDSA